MNISNLKSRFPVFKKNPNLVFLDTAASALKVDEMIEATNNCYANEYANIHRGNYELSSIAQFIFDVTDTANCKIKFGYEAEVAPSSSVVNGSTNNNRTNFIAIRLGDT